MKPEISLLKYFLSYNNWKQYNAVINVKEDIAEELKLLYRTLHSFHSSNDEGVDLAVQDLANLFWVNKPKDTEYYESVLDQIEKYIPVEDTVVSLIESIRRARLLRDLSIASYEAAEGKTNSDKVYQLISELDTVQTLDEETDEFVTTDLETLFNETTAVPGLTWRLTCLNQSLGSLRPGDFGFIFARPETGKTTFLASEVSHMLHQAEALSRPIVWFNNEEQGNKVMLRIIQSYYGVTLEQLYSNLSGYQDSFRKSGGLFLKLYDSAAINRHTVERITTRESPCLVIFDQLDKIQGFDGEREDLLLGSKYQFGRELAKHGFAVIGCSQADGTGENVRWLSMQHVANAKTAKQAEADFIIGIGKVHDTGYESMRYINISKNKLAGDQGVSIPELRHGKLTVQIDPQIARYMDV